MERQLRPAPASGTFTVEATAALRAVSSHEAPLLLAYHPSYARNPYQELLYGAAWTGGIAPVRMPRWWQLPELVALQQASLSTVLHLHWLQPVQRDAASEADARRLGAAFIADLDAYRAAGGRLAWTIHNILPHETRYEAAEAALCAAVAARADAIHVLTAGTPDLVAPHYELPRDRVLHVPHPSYRGAYPNHMTREAARHDLGLSPDELVVAALGDIRPYKGLDELLDAWRLAPADRPRRLLIAGAPADVPGVAALVERAALETDVLIDARHIPADELQVVLRSADVAVLPYRRALNSGALLLALTFGLPVIVPEGGGLAEIVDPAFARTFVAGDRKSLAAALANAADLATPEAARAARRAAAEHDPQALSEQFARELRKRLAG